MKLDKRACRHAANVPLHISLNAGVLYTERVKYLVTAAVKLLGHTTILGTTEWIGFPQVKKHGAGPIILQSHGDPSEPISFRNIWIREL